MFDFVAFAARVSVILIAAILLGACIPACSKMTPYFGNGEWTGTLVPVDVVDGEGFARRCFILEVTEGTAVYDEHAHLGFNGPLAPFDTTGMRVLLVTEDEKLAILAPGEQASGLAVRLNAALIAGNDYLTVSGTAPKHFLKISSSKAGYPFKDKITSDFPIKVKEVTIEERPRHPAAAPDSN